MVSPLVSPIAYTLHSPSPHYLCCGMIHMESPALECCLAISFMHFPEFLMVFGQGLDNEGVASVNI